MDKAGPYDKLALLRMLTHAHAQADAYFETIGDAAALAANQVQDVRLEYLEKGPTVTAADVVLELFLSVALQYVGGKAVEVITKEVMRRVLSSRSALLLIGGRTEYGDNVAATYRAARMLSFTELGVEQAKKGYELGAKAADVVLRRQVFESGVEKFYNDTPFTVADLATKVVFHAGRQLPQKPPRYSRLSPQDSPGVTLLDNVSLFVVRQKTFNKIAFDDVVHIVLLDLLNRDDMLKLIKDLEMYTTGLYGTESLIEIKQRYKLFFEACIWSRIFDPPPPLKHWATLDLGERSADMTKYLLARIVSPETETPFGELIEDLPPQLQRRSDKSSNEEQVLQSLLGYFRQLRRTMAETEALLPTEGRSQWEYR